VLYRKLAHTSVEVVVSAFEDWPLPKEPFDALCAFTAWHWLAPMSVQSRPLPRCAQAGHSPR
jgi:hypothetical protein